MIVQRNSITRILTTVAAFALFVLVHVAEARPEFALRIGQNRCTACHYTPSGGGPKNSNGKYYGSGAFKLNSFSSQPYAGADLKMLYYLPEKHTETVGGAGVMAGNIYASLPLLSDEKGQKETRVVVEHNLGGFASGPRQFYLRWQFYDDLQFKWRPQYILLGRIIPAFGLMTDEHRTYVRMQTATTWNRGFETGVQASGNPLPNWHYDLAVVNGQKNLGQALNSGQATQWGVVGNIRYLNAKRPYLLGVSGSYHEEGMNVGDKPPYAMAAYGAFSFHRWWNMKVPLTLMAEYAQAARWNHTFTPAFVTDGAYGASVAESQSEGWFFQANWDLTPKLVLLYKYDRLALDRDYPGDVYQRHGIGVKHYVGPMMWVHVRFEKAETSVPSEKNSTRAGGLDAVWALLNVGI